MNVFFKLYHPQHPSRAKREIDIQYYETQIEAKAVFHDDRYTFSLPPELDQKMMAGEIEADFRLAPSADLTPAPVCLVLTDRYW